MMHSQPHIAIIGAGIVGLAHAWAAASAGHRVTVFERHCFAQGASIRNFGMLWPIGQPPSLLPVALRSREKWLEFVRHTGVYARECGSVHVVSREDELAVIREFSEAGRDLGYRTRVLSPSQVGELCPAVRSGDILGGLHSTTEINVDPREAIARLPDFLHRHHQVRFHFGLAVTHVETGSLRCADGSSHRFDRILVCSGAEFETLFPEAFHQSPLKRCKLQMLRTIPQPGHWELGPMLASGLTLRHYANFSICPSIGKVRERIARTRPELDRYGIHVMASQDRNGCIVLGDSHEYDDDITVFDRQEIDDLMLAELAELFDFPSWTIGERWHGIYAKNPNGEEFRTSPLPGVHIVNGLGGAGMTMSFGLAERFFQETPVAV